MIREDLACLYRALEEELVCIEENCEYEDLEKGPFSSFRFLLFGWCCAHGVGTQGC